MKIKRFLKNFVAGAAVLAIAGTASATTVNEINIYGASAQFTLWNAVASTYITSKSACSGVTPTVKSYYPATGSVADKVTYATCGDTTYIIRVSSKASYDGIMALKGDNSMAASAACTASDISGSDSGNYKYYRKMANEDSGSGSTASSLKCVKVTIGASDVNGAAITQYSLGRVNGPATAVATAPIERNQFSAGVTTSGLSSANPLVVPFAFYVNTSNSTLITALNGNLTRMQAVLLFSGQVANWNTLGKNYPDLHTVLCMRHAGSGSHATLDYAVLNHSGWGGGLVKIENRPDENSIEPYELTYNSSQPIVYFNDGTSTELDCLQGQTGAIGYADADKAWKSTDNSISYTPIPGYANVNELMYQGERASADGIANGRYDFWTNEWAYYPSNLSTDQNALVSDFLNYDLSKLPTGEQNFWAKPVNMLYQKATDDVYPSSGQSIQQ